MDDEPTFDLDAAGLGADGADGAGGLEGRARALGGSLPQATRVRRRSKRLFGGDKVVESVEVRLGTTRYGLEVDGHTVSADRRQEGGGGGVRREPLELSQWVDALTGDLREQAANTAQARLALERLIG